jgi:hypothetical protein
MQLSISGLLSFFGSLLDRLFATVLSAVPRTQKIPRDKLQERLKRDIDSRDSKKKGLKDRSALLGFFWQLLFGVAFALTKATLRGTWLYPVTVKML